MMLTALAATRDIVASAIRDSNSIKSFARAESGKTSVGLNAVALVNAR